MAIVGDCDKISDLVVIGNFGAMGYFYAIMGI